jgi:GTP cyclohydrolase I
MVQFANPPAKDASDSGGDEVDSVNASGQNTPNGIGSSKKFDSGEGGRKRKRKRNLKANGESHSKRRHSVSKPARDPRDDPSPIRPAPKDAGTRSPSPVIDFDGLSHPSMTPLLLSPLPPVY